MKLIKLLSLTLVLGGIVWTYFYLMKQKSKTILDWGKEVAFEIPKDKITKTKLENGMTILIMQDKNIPKVLMQIAYNVGSAIEDAGERGLAHLIEHMIFKGTEKLSESDIDTIARKYGASLNAFTYQDATSYYFEVDNNNWKPFLFILADCMANARFDSQHLASEVKAVIAELKMYRDNYFRFIWDEAFKILFPANHPYHYPIIGYKEDLLNLSSEKLKAFYKKYYHPNKATLFVIGDVDPKEIISEVKKNFGQIPAAKDEVKEIVNVSTDLISHDMKIYRDIDRPKFGFIWRIPGAKDNHEVLVEALEFILGDGEGSRIYRRLVDREKIANAISVGSGELLHGGLFAIFVDPKDGKLEECKKIILEELKNVVENGVTKDELLKIINNKKRSMFSALQSFQTFAYMWITSYFATEDEFDIFKRINRLNDLTTESLQKFAKIHLDPFMVSEIQLLPAPKDKMDILLKGQQREDELDKKILSKQIRTAPQDGVKFAKTLPEPAKIKFSYPKPSQEFNLKNGIKVVFHKNDRWPFLNFNIQFRDGAFLNEIKEGILVDLLMRMLIEGCEGFSKDDSVEFFETTATDYNFTAGGVFISTLTENIDAVLKRLSHVLQNPTFPKESLEKLRSIFIDSFTEQKKDPASVAMRMLQNLLYPNHPYNWTFDEAIEYLKHITVEDLVKAHKKYLSPEGLIISAAGNFDLDNLKKTVTGAFSNIQGEKYKPLTISTEVKNSKSQLVDHFMLRDQVVFLMGQPSPINIYDNDLTPLKLLNIACFSSLGSRIYQIRETTGLFYVARGAFAAKAMKEHGFDYLYSILSIENLDKTEKLMRDMIENVAKNGITQEEFEISKKIYIKSIIDLADKNSYIASQLATLESLGLGFDYYDKVMDRVQKMSLSEVNNVAKKYFNTKNMHKIRVGRIGNKS
ncbi:insulinase family protein [Candidatus Babeliales bacterium]|nr:insulinase family protein [Candidatus Babeliales bacterium]